MENRTADRKGDRHPKPPIIGEALEGVDDVRVADREGTLGILRDIPYSLSALERNHRFMAEEGLRLGDGRQERQFSAAPGTAGDEHLQVRYALRNDLREQLTVAIHRVDTYLGWELRAGQRVVLNGQLSVGRVRKDSHWYVRAAAFWYGLALDAGTYGRIKVKGKLVAVNIRQRQVGVNGLGGCVERAAAGQHN